MTYNSSVSCIIVACLVLGTVIYFIFHNIAFKNFFKKYKQAQRMRFGFYECGLRTRKQGSIEFNIQYYAILLVSIVYDIECVLLLILFVNINFFGFFDIIILLSYCFFFLFGYYLDWRMGTFTWTLF